MSKYNKCEGCELWNGHHCIGARSYEPNADEHRIICNEHMAKQFWVVYQQLHRSEARVKELEEYKKSKQASYEAMQAKNNNLEWEKRELEKKVKELEEENNDLKGLNKQLENMRENYYKEYLKTDKKLKIAEEALKIIPNASYNGASKDELSYIAQQALRKMKEIEVQNDN